MSVEGTLIKVDYKKSRITLEHCKPVMEKKIRKDPIFYHFNSRTRKIIIIKPVEEKND